MYNKQPVSPPKMRVGKKIEKMAGTDLRPRRPVMPAGKVMGKSAKSAYAKGGMVKGKKSC
jgi:hypothetical protein